MAEKMVGKVAAIEEAGGWLEAGRRGVLGCVLSRHCCSKRQA